MRDAYRTYVRGILDRIRADGFHKAERVIASPQAPEIELAGGARVLNFCANNYLGLADDARLIEAAREGLARHGFGTASVRFICGTQDVHKELEAALANFLGTDDAILYSSCFDANGGLFETLLSEEDAIISDELNHASIVDGIRLCKAKRYRYRNNDMADLDDKLADAAAANARFIMVATDGVFSMDGIIADLPAICTLAERYGALTMVDDSHAVGFVGEHGRGRLSSRGQGRASISSPERSARRWAARPAAMSRARARSSNCCGSARVRTCSRMRWRRRSPPRRCACCICSTRPKAPRCASASATTARDFAVRWRRRGSNSYPAAIRSSR
jgi:glycine C-acetyltransferase